MPVRRYNPKALTPTIIITSIAILFGSSCIEGALAAEVLDNGTHRLLDNISKQQLLLERRRARDGRFISPAVRDGVPEGVNCNVTQRCDSQNVCARVCTPGSVRVEPWLRFALDYQWQLARRQPLCFAQLLGTHNSAITLADGYGMHDDIYTQYLRYLRLASGGQALVTNNQVLSLTDQLRLGVRFVELDVHWIQGALHIAHCGGFHSPRLNQLVGLISEVARMFGHPPVQWDAETLGCNPSLSSLPTGDQRLFPEALAELSAWLFAPGHAAEFLVLFLDNQPDLAAWGKVELLFEQVTAAIPAGMIITPPELRNIVEKRQGVLPSIDELVRVYGKRVLLMSATDYGDQMAGLAFNHHSPCNLTEPLFRGFEASPHCAFHNWHYHSDTPAMSGRIIRTPTCHLTYGPYNCSLQHGMNDAQLDLEQLPGATTCGINVPAPDMLTPQLVQSYIWSWAPGHPALQLQQHPTAPGATNGSMEGVEDLGLEAGQCAQLRSGDGRWVVQPCGAARYAACRLNAGPHHLAGPDAWALAEVHSGWLKRWSCPAGYVHDAPRTARENLDLWNLLLAALRQQQDQLQGREPRGAQQLARKHQLQDKAGQRRQVPLMQQQLEQQELGDRSGAQIRSYDRRVPPARRLRSQEQAGHRRMTGAVSRSSGAVPAGQVNGGLRSEDDAGAGAGVKSGPAASGTEVEEELYVLLALKPPSWLPGGP